MKKVLNRLRESWVPATYYIIKDEEGVGVVEIILILVDKLTTQNPYCVDTVPKRSKTGGFKNTIHSENLKCVSCYIPGTEKRHSL